MDGRRRTTDIKQTHLAKHRVQVHGQSTRFPMLPRPRVPNKSVGGVQAAAVSYSRLYGSLSPLKCDLLMFCGIVSANSSLATQRTGDEWNWETATTSRRESYFKSLHPDWN